ncbi:hypothetical protein AB4084_26700, partial [Lysobacter sp. 2RAB21]
VDSDVADAALLMTDFESAQPSFPRRRESRDFSAIPPSRHSREGGNPVPFVRERLKSLDSRLRGNDDLGRAAVFWTT